MFISNFRRNKYFLKSLLGVWFLFLGEVVKKCDILKYILFHIYKIWERIVFTQLSWVGLSWFESLSIYSLSIKILLGFLKVCGGDGGV